MSESRTWDSSMVDRIRVGDDGALAAVYDRYGAMVHAVASQLIGADQANDITQDVFVDLWQHPDRFDAERGALRGWLALIARRRAIDMVRSVQRRRARERRAFAAGASSERSVEDVAVASVAGGLVHDAIERLPADQRRAIELAYLDGLTFRDVARATGTAEGTAKSRLRLGLRRLATDLTERGESASATT